MIQNQPEEDTIFSQSLRRQRSSSLNTESSKASIFSLNESAGNSDGNSDIDNDSNNNNSTNSLNRTASFRSTTSSNSTSINNSNLKRKKSLKSLNSQSSDKNDPEKNFARIWSVADTKRLLLEVKSTLNKHPKMTKTLWKKVAEDINTDICYSWKECHFQFSKVKKERIEKAKYMKTQEQLLKNEELANAELQNKINQARKDWNDKSKQRQELVGNENLSVFNRFGTHLPEKVLLELEKRPKGRKLGLRTFVMKTWIQDVWQTEVLKQFGKTWLYGYGVTPDVRVEFHYDGGKKFDVLSSQIYDALKQWELCTKITGPELKGKEGLLLKKLSKECLSLDYKHEEDTASNNTLKGGWLKKAEIELGENHICYVQLLVLSVSLRLKLLDRETELSNLRSNGIVLQEKSKKVYHTLSEEDIEAAEKRQKEDKERKRIIKTTSVDAVKYSPSMKRERSIKSLVRDIDRAVKICERVYASSNSTATSQSLDKYTTKDVETLHVLAYAKLVRALTLAAAGTHWIVSEWTRSYSTISTVAIDIMKSSTKFALETAVARWSARYERIKVRKLWENENNRLKNIDETYLRRQRASLRQEYRKQKKRGRPGRIEMKQAKNQLELVQMDLDHCLKIKWHPKHDMLRPSLETPREWERLGLPKPLKEKMPEKWIKCVPYYDKKSPPYYVNVDTGIPSFTNPLTTPDSKTMATSPNTCEKVDEKTNDNSCNDEEENTKKKAQNPVNPTPNTDTKKLTDEKEIPIIQIDPDDIVEQHRMYFREAFESAKESCDILTSLKSPLLFEATAAISRVCSLAGRVGDSEGNQATGLSIESSELNNMSCKYITLAMQQAEEAGLRYTLEYASMCRRAARYSQYRRHDGDMSDAAERLKEALEIYKCLRLKENVGAQWHTFQATLELNSLGEFSGYLIPEDADTDFFLPQISPRK